MFESKNIFENLNKDIIYELFSYIDKDYLKFINNKKSELSDYFYPINLLKENKFFLFDYLQENYLYKFKFDLKRLFVNIFYNIRYKHDNYEFDFDFENNITFLFYKIFSLYPNQKIELDANLFFILFKHKKEWFIKYFNYFKCEKHIYLDVLNNDFFKKDSDTTFLQFLRDKKCDTSLIYNLKKDNSNNFKINQIINNDNFMNYSFLNYFFIYHKDFIFKENSVQEKPINILIQKLLIPKYFDLFIELKEHFKLNSDFYIYIIKNQYNEKENYLLKLMELNTPKNANVCEYVASIDNLNLLKFLHNHNFPWNENTTFAACENLNFNCLLYSLENGCKTNLNIFNIIKKQYSNIVTDNNQLEKVFENNKTSNNYIYLKNQIKLKLNKIEKINDLVKQYFYFNSSF
jgi:hypothetical protein